MLGHAFTGNVDHRTAGPGRIAQSAQQRLHHQRPHRPRRQPGQHQAEDGRYRHGVLRGGGSPQQRAAAGQQDQVEGAKSQQRKFANDPVAPGNATHAVLAPAISPDEADVGIGRHHYREHVGEHCQGAGNNRHPRRKHAGRQEQAAEVCAEAEELASPGPLIACPRNG